MKKTEFNHSLYQIGLLIQENVLEGYRLVEGYPIQIGAYYELQMEIVPEAHLPKAKPGRPAKDKPPAA